MFFGAVFRMGFRSRCGRVVCIRLVDHIFFDSVGRVFRVDFGRLWEILQYAEGGGLIKSMCPSGLW